MPAKKFPTTPLRPIFDANANANANTATGLPAVFASALGATPQQPRTGRNTAASTTVEPVRIDQSARGARAGVHVTKTEVPRSGHR